jgi:hypothetical protein
MTAGAAVSRRLRGRPAARFLRFVVTLSFAYCLLAGGATHAEEAAALTAPPADASAADPSLVRITSSFDVIHASAVLRQVGKLFHAGFVRRDADGVAKEILVMPAEQSRLWSFTVIYKRGSYPLQIRARLDDFGMLDLDFFSTPAVAGAVRGAVDGYLNSRKL